MIFFLRKATNQDMNLNLLLMNQKNNKFEPCWRRKGTKETKGNNRFLFLFDMLMLITDYIIINIYYNTYIYIDITNLNIR